jgi:hypothetical protein
MPKGPEEKDKAEEKKEPDEKNEMESAVKANNLKAGNAQVSEHHLGPDRLQDISSDLSRDLLKNPGQGGTTPLKISMVLKVVAFCFSVVTLSWFFEGMRQCKAAATPEGLCYLLGGTLLTILLVAVQAFFVYCEERSKNSRTRKIALFDKWYVFLTSKQKGDYTNRG